jgi:hypothetical protein
LDNDGQEMALSHPGGGVTSPPEKVGRLWSFLRAASSKKTMASKAYGVRTPFWYENDDAWA